MMIVERADKLLNAARDLRHGEGELHIDLTVSPRDPSYFVLVGKQSNGREVVHIHQLCFDTLAQLCEIVGAAARYVPVGRLDGSVPIVDTVRQYLREQDPRR